MPHTSHVIAVGLGVMGSAAVWRLSPAGIFDQAAKSIFSVLGAMSVLQLVLRPFFRMAAHF